MQTSEVLNRAADLIEERGWGVGADMWGYEGKSLCLEGGILAALGTNFNEVDICHGWFDACPAYSAVASYLELSGKPNAIGRSDHELWRWNDESGRTAAEVVEVLRACAVIEASREREAVFPHQPTGYSAPVVGVSS